MTKALSYRVVDVFTQHALEGNALAVFPDGSGLSDDLMQKIARELNLSETVFAFPPSGPEYAARLRIFTPQRELPFAGHPTIGAAFVLLDEGIISGQSAEFVLEEAIGAVPVRIENGLTPLIWLTTPPIHDGPSRDAALCAKHLGLEAQDLLPTEPRILSAGNPTLFVAVQDPPAVDRAWLESAGLRHLRGDYPEPICAFIFAPTKEGAYSRMFAPEYGIAEDPATGSSTGPLAVYMLRNGLLSAERRTQFVSEQGNKMGRRSLLHVRISQEQNVIEVGGHVTLLASAMMRL